MNGIKGKVKGKLSRDSRVGTLFSASRGAFLCFLSNLDSVMHNVAVKVFPVTMGSRAMKFLKLYHLAMHIAYLYILKIAIIMIIALEKTRQNNNNNKKQQTI